MPHQHSKVESFFSVICYVLFCLVYKKNPVVFPLTVFKWYPFHLHTQFCTPPTPVRLVAMVAMFLSLGHWVSYAWDSRVQRQTQRPKMQVKHTTILNDDQLNGFPLIGFLTSNSLRNPCHGAVICPRWCCECDLPSGSLLKRCHRSHLTHCQSLKFFNSWGLVARQGSKKGEINHLTNLEVALRNAITTAKCRRQVGFHDWIELQKALRPRSKGGNLSTRGTTWILFSRWRIIPFRVLSNHHV